MARKVGPSNVVPFRRPSSPGGRNPFRWPAWLPRTLVATVTGWIVLANAAVWVAMIVASRGGGLFREFPAETTWAFGSLVPHLVPAEPWRLLTATFVHAGLGHIALNMAILWFVGQRLEAAYGHGRFLALYLGAALTGAMFSLVWYAVGSAGSSVGASGGVLGVVGGTWAFFWKATGKDSPMTRQWQWFAVLGVVAGMVLSFFGMPVDNAGHLGGMVGGFGLSWLFAGRPAWSRGLTRAVLGLGFGTVAASFALSLALGDRLDPFEPPPPPETHRAANEAIARGDWETAEAKLAEAIRESSSDPLLRTMRARALAQLGREDEAIAELVTAEALLDAMRRREPGNANYGAAHAEVLLALDRGDDAERVAVDAIDGAGNADAFGAIAELLEGRGKLEEARRAAAKARRLDSARWRETHQRINQKLSQ